MGGGTSGDTDMFFLVEEKRKKRQEAADWTGLCDHDDDGAKMPLEVDWDEGRSRHRDGRSTR